MAGVLGSESSLATEHIATDHDSLQARGEQGGIGASLSFHHVVEELIGKIGLAKLIVYKTLRLASHLIVDRAGHLPASAVCDVDRPLALLRPAGELANKVDR